MIREPISFPVVTFRSNEIDAARSIDELCTCNNLAYRNRWYNGLELIDSKGLFHKVNTANREEGNPFIQFYRCLFNAKCKVTLIFSEHTMELELNTIQTRLIDAMNVDRYFWESFGDFDEQVIFIKNESSIESIIKKFTDGFFREH